MNSILDRFWEDLISRPAGPMSFRFTFQPLMAILLATVAGWKDAKAGRPAFLWTVLSDPKRRKALIRDGWKDITKVFTVAAVLDMVFQIAQYGRIYPLESLAIATALAIVPYALTRGPINRLLRFFLIILLSLGIQGPVSAQESADVPLFHDSHVHITNYVQEGVDPMDFLKTMGTRVGRSVLFGIPLQQQWSHRNSGDSAPTYYLHSDSPLYYYSFNDAWIAANYLRLNPTDRARFDPMITGFNPSDMYASDHIRRVLKTFPGVFSGIGEFTIHKEFVSSKVSGEVASLRDPALDRVLDTAAEIGLVALMHCDVDAPFAKEKAKPVYLDQIRSLLRRHPDTTIVWAHTGLGRVIHPIHNHLAMMQSILNDSAFNHVYFDLSWDELAKYVVGSDEAVEKTAALINRYPDRFLFGTDEVAPKETSSYLKVYRQYDPLWSKLKPEASRKVRLANYERIFNHARAKVRAWEKKHAPPIAAAR